jgi:hypothetical protein
MQGLLHIRGELPRFFYLLLQGDLLHQVLKFVNRLIGDCIFPRGYFQRLRRGGKVQVIGFYPAGVGIVAGVRVD